MAEMNKESATQGQPEEKEMEAFDELIDSYLSAISEHKVDSVISVPIIDIQSEHILVDLGDKAEGLIKIEEFQDTQGKITAAVGDQIDVLIIDREEETGLIIVSHREARQRGAWKRISEAHEQHLPVSGRVSRAIGKGAGLLVDVGIECFLPASQIAERRESNIESWIGQEIDALVISIDARKRRVVLSRRQLIEETKRRMLEQALATIHEGDLIKATVQAVQNFGAFLSTETIDVFMPREEISWDRAASPSSILSVGSTLETKVVQIDHETGRVRVSRKALCEDPWKTAAQKYPEGKQVQGEVVSVTRYGAFVRIEEGLTGMIHVSDLTWNKGEQRVEEHVKEGDTVSAVILSIDTQKRRMALGLKQMVEDPWIEAERQFPKGSKVKAKVTSLATFGAFVQLTDNIDGLIHISDFSWETRIKHPQEVLSVGQEVEAQVLKTDRNTRRISLGLKQLTDSPATRFFRDHKVGSIVEGEVARMIPMGVFINLAPHVDGFMHVSQIAEERIEKPENVFKVGDKVRCKISRIDRGSNKISLSRKDLLQEEQAQAVKQFKADPKSKGVMKLGELLQRVITGKSGQSDGE